MVIQKKNKNKRARTINISSSGRDLCGLQREQKARGTRVILFDYRAVHDTLAAQKRKKSITSDNLMASTLKKFIKFLLSVCPDQRGIGPPEKVFRTAGIFSMHIKKFFKNIFYLRDVMEAFKKCTRVLTGSHRASISRVEH